MVSPKSGQTICFTIQAGSEKIRIDRVLANHPEIRTRSRCEKLIARGLVTLRGQPVKSSHLTELGEIYQITLPEAEPSELQPFDFKLSFVYEDQDLMVINKPAGLVMHPAFGHTQDTLVNALVFHGHPLSMGFSENRPGIVHRLDKETSGLVVIAKNDLAHENLALQFRNRQVHRVYWAICYGHLREKHKTIESNLGRHPANRKKFASIPAGGKQAVSHYEVLEESDQGLSWLKLKLGTGRTHQIRVHLSELNHPVVGDTLYASARRPQSLRSPRLTSWIHSCTRLALHATELGFVHPTKNEKLSFSAAWPDDLIPLLKMAGFGYLQDHGSTD